MISKHRPASGPRQIPRTDDSHHVQVRALNPDNHRELEALAALASGAEGADGAGRSGKRFWLALTESACTERRYTGLLAWTGDRLVGHLGLEIVPQRKTIAIHHLMVSGGNEDSRRSVGRALLETVRAQADRLQIGSAVLFSRQTAPETAAVIDTVFAGVHVATLPSCGSADAGFDRTVDVFLVPLADEKQSSVHRVVYPPLSHLPLVNAIYKRLPLTRELGATVPLERAGQPPLQLDVRCREAEAHCRTGYLRNLGLHYVYLEPGARSVTDHLRLCAELIGSQRLARRPCITLIPITRPGSDAMLEPLEQHGWQVVGLLPEYLGEDLLVLAKEPRSSTEDELAGPLPRSRTADRRSRATIYDA